MKLVKFREARLNDLHTLNTISVRSKGYWGYPDSWMKQWSDELTLDKAKFAQQNIIVAENEDQSIGFCSIVDNKESYEILHFWIIPEFIGLGYGIKLLKETIDRFVQAGKPIIVTADPNAESFYSSQGFATFDYIESYPKGRYLPVMKKPNALV